MATLTLMPESAIHQHSTCKEAAGGETGSNALIGTEDAADQAAAEQHAPYWKTLQNMLAQKREMVLDFTSLKACLDPQKEKSDGDDVRTAHVHAHSAPPLCACVGVDNISVHMHVR